MKKIVGLSIFLVLALSLSAQNQLGNWIKDKDHLPSFTYTASLPFSATMKNGAKAKLPEDPWFLLGNYRLTLFTHISGNYELITGERAWGRINQGDVPNSGLNSASIALQKKGAKTKEYNLTGIHSLAADPTKCTRTFGCGYAVYSYQTNEVTCQRTLAVKPSMHPREGLSAFLLTIKIKNRQNQTLPVTYTESITAHYQMMQQQRMPANERLVQYQNEVAVNAQQNCIKANIHGITADPMLAPNKDAISTYDAFPPSLFMKALSGVMSLKHTVVSNDKDELSAVCNMTLQPHEEKEIQLAIGYSFDTSFATVDSICNLLQTGEETYSNEWKQRLPKFDKEQDTALKQELIWHAYNLEAMATYNSFYDETEIPQGTVYDYDWGIHASARDHLQHALPLVYYNPELAKSVLRYMMKRTTNWGEIRLMEAGYGFAHAGSYFTSDQQLFFFLLLSEYLRVTKDVAFLHETVTPYPVKNMQPITVWNIVENCFTFLRDQIGTGSHGLVRLMNSDWNDAVFYIVNAPYNRVLYSGESHMNTAMALTIFDNLIPQLGAASTNTKDSLLIKSMSLYREHLLSAFMKDLGNRSFPKRMYFNGETYGESNMFLEPQGYTLQMKELSTERKRKLYYELQERLYKGEKLGAREQQTPQFEDKEFDKGSRENGGFWYALNGPVIIGVAQFDKGEAMRLLQQMSFANYAKCFPQYWSSYWSASDNVESSLIPMEGLPDQSASYSDSPVYCAHSHAWILYCYYKIHEP